MSSDNSDNYFTTYINDTSLFLFLEERSRDFNSRSNYIRELVKKDSEGLIAWEGEIDRDLLIEKINAVLEALGISVETKRQKHVEIGENVTVSEAIDILTQEGIL
jgi:hypothetical protein